MSNESTAYTIAATTVGRRRMMARNHFDVSPDISRGLRESVGCMSISEMEVPPGRRSQGGYWESVVVNAVPWPTAYVETRVVNVRMRRNLPRCRQRSGLGFEPGEGPQVINVDDKPAVTGRRADSGFRTLRSPAPDGRLVGCRTTVTWPRASTRLLCDESRRN